MSASDEGFIIANQGFVERHIEDFNAIPFYLRRKFEKNCPTFVKFRSDVISRGLRRSQEMVNQMFDLNVENKRCRLDGGAIANKLIAVYNDSGKKKIYTRQFSQSLEKARNDWIERFYEIRNVVTHRDEFISSSLPIHFDSEDHPRHSLKHSS